MLFGVAFTGSGEHVAVRLCGIWTIRAKSNEPWRRVEWAGLSATRSPTRTRVSPRAARESASEPEGPHGVSGVALNHKAGGDKVDQPRSHT